jgi:hypothetical protein
MMKCQVIEEGTLIADDKCKEMLNPETHGRDTEFHNLIADEHRAQEEDSS